MKKRKRRKLFTVACLIAAGFLLASGLLSHFYPYSRLDIFRSEFRPTDWQKSDEIDTDTLRLRVINEQGEPVVGAVIGDILWGSFNSTNAASVDTLRKKYKGHEVHISETEYALLHFIEPFLVPPSTAEGIIDIPSEALIAAGEEWQAGRPQALYVVHPAHRIGALACYRPDDLGSSAELVLRPLCHVQGTVQRADGKALPVANIVAFWGPMKPWHMFPVKQAGERINMLLPPGQYRIWGIIVLRDEQGARSKFETVERVDIADGMRDINLALELEPREQPD